MTAFFADGDTVDHYTIMPTCMWGVGTANEELFKSVIQNHTCSSSKTTGCAKKMSVLSCPTENMQKKSASYLQQVKDANADVERWTKDLHEANSNVHFSDFNKATEN